MIKKYISIPHNINSFKQLFRGIMFITKTNIQNQIYKTITNYWYYQKYHTIPVYHHLKNSRQSIVASYNKCDIAKIMRYSSVDSIIYLKSIFGNHKAGIETMNYFKTMIIFYWTASHFNSKCYHSANIIFKCPTYWENLWVFYLFVHIYP